MVIDWLSFAIEYEYLNEACSYLGVDYTGFEKGFSVYKTSLQCWFFSGACIYSDITPSFSYHTPDFDGKFFIVFSGSGMAFFKSDVDRFEFIKFMKDLGAVVNRLDIAFDDMSGGLTVSKCIKCWKSGDVVSSFRSGLILEGVSLDGIIGHTFYIGHSRSRAYIRIYDKRLLELSRIKKSKQKFFSETLPLYWTRLEIQYNRKYANAIFWDWYLTISEKNLNDGSFFSSDILGRIDFITSSGRRRRWYSSLLGSQEGKTIRLSRPAPSIESIAAWLKNSVSPSLALMILEFDEEWLNTIIKHGADRLTKQKLKLLSHGG